MLSAILNNYGPCLSLETTLTSYILSHTQRVQSAKELALTLPSVKHPELAQEEKDTTRKLRSKRAGQLSKQEVKTRAQVALLRAQCDALVKAMTAACKPKDPVPLKHKPNLTLQGTNLLLHSSWNWQTISTNSRTRDFQNIAGVAVLEFNIISEYRERLIQSEPAASLLCLSLATQFKPYMKRASSFFAP